MLLQPLNYLREKRIERYVRQEFPCFDCRQSLLIQNPAPTVQCRCSFDIGENPGQIGYLNELPTDDIDWVKEKWYYPNKIGNTLNKQEFKGTVVLHGCQISREYHYQKPDTCIEQAFCVDNRVYCIVTTPETTSIERVDNGRFERVADLGRRFDFTNGFYPEWQLDDHLRDFNRSNDGCRLVFRDAFHNGTLTVNDYTVHIQYVRLNVLP